MNEFFNFCLKHWQISALFTTLLVVYILFELYSSKSSRKLTPEQAVAMYNHEQAIILDIRSKAAYEQGHIVGSINFAALDLESNLKKLNKYAQQPVIVVCALGRDTPKVIAKLQANNFTNLWELGGGIQAWQYAGLPLTTN